MQEKIELFCRGIFVVLLLFLRGEDIVCLLKSDVIYNILSHLDHPMTHRWGQSGINKCLQFDDLLRMPGWTELEIYWYILYIVIREKREPDKSSPQKPSSTDSVVGRGESPSVDRLSHGDNERKKMSLEIKAHHRNLKD
jgi:hypothetical protein